MDILNFAYANPLFSALLSTILMYGASLLGAILMYFFAAKNGLEGSIPKIQQLIPGKSQTFYFRFDFLIVIVLGPVVGLICFRPQDAFQALAAGCGWVSAVNVLVQQKPALPSPPPSNPPAANGAG